MTRDGTVGRSDATERSLTFGWDNDLFPMIASRRLQEQWILRCTQNREEIGIVMQRRNRAANTYPRNSSAFLRLLP